MLCRLRTTSPGVSVPWLAQTPTQDAIQQATRPLKMDDLPSLWARNAGTSAPYPQGSTSPPGQVLAPTVSSTAGSPFTNPQGLGSLASTVLPGMWRRASQPVPNYILDEISQAPVAAPVEATPVPPKKAKQQVSTKRRAPARKPAASRLRIPALSTGSSRPSSQLSSVLSDIGYEPVKALPLQDTATKRTSRLALLVSCFSKFGFSLSPACPAKRFGVSQASALFDELCHFDCNVSKSVCYTHESLWHAEIICQTHSTLQSAHLQNTGGSSLQRL